MKTFKEWWQTQGWSLIEDNETRSHFYQGGGKAWDACAKEYEARLKEAEEVIAFYANPKNWQYPGNDFHDFLIAKEDVSEAFWVAKTGKEMRGRKAGKRAREYQRKYLTGENE